MIKQRQVGKETSRRGHRAAAAALLLLLAGLLTLWAWRSPSTSDSAESIRDGGAAGGAANVQPRCAGADGVEPSVAQAQQDRVDRQDIRDAASKQASEAFVKSEHISLRAPFSALHPVLGATFLTPGQLFTFDQSGVLALWSVPEGELIRASASSAVDTAAFVGLASDFRSWVFALVGDRVYRWDAQTLSCESFPLELEVGHTSCVVYVPATQCLAIGCSGGVLIAWDATRCTQQRILTLPGANDVKRLHLSSDGGTLYAEASPRPEYGATILLDASHLNVISQSDADEDFNYAGFLARGDRIVVQKAGYRQVAKMPGTAAALTVLHEDTLTAEVMAYAPDVHLGIALSRSGQVLTVDPDTLLTVNASAEDLCSSAGHLSLAVAGADGLVAVCDSGNAVRLFRCGRHSPPEELPTGVAVAHGAPSCAAEAPQDGQVYVGTQRGMVRRLDLRNAAYVRQLRVCHAPVISIDYCGCSKVVLCLTALGLHICDEDLGRVLYSRTIPTGATSLVCAVGVKDRCAVLVSGRVVEVWNYVAGNVESSLSLAFEPSRLTSGQAAGEVFAAVDRRWCLLDASGGSLIARTTRFSDSYDAILARDGGIVARNSGGELLWWKADQSHSDEDTVVILGADNDDLEGMPVFVTRRVLWYREAGAFLIEDQLGVSACFGGAMMRLPGSTFGTNIAAFSDGNHEVSLLRSDGTIVVYALK